jgi:pimeloyl-ACP methyl ester carboxylesterase
MYPEVMIDMGFINIRLMVQLFLVWLVVEILFWFVLHFAVVEPLQRLTKPQKYLMHPRELCDKIFETIDSLETYSYEMFMSGFFRGAQVSEIKRDNMLSFLAWAMYASHLKDISREDRVQVEAVCDEAARRYGPLPDGFNPAVRHIAMTLEPVPYIHRPLALYIGVGVIEVFTNVLFFQVKGFQRFELQGQTYWFRPKAKKSTDGCEQLPVVFYHGICPGWLAYAGLIDSIVHAAGAGRDRDVFLVDLDCTKIKSLVFTMPSPEHHADCVAAILAKHGVKKVSIVGHSFGSIAAAWFVKRHVDMVAHVSMLDPVSLLLFFPEVAYAFLYRYPSTFVEWVIYLAAAKEITIAHTLYRNFWWYNNLLFLEDLPPHIGVIVGLSGSDEVNNATTLMEYVGKCRDLRQNAHAEAGSDAPPPAPIESVYWPGFSHGQVLVSPYAQRSFCKALGQHESLLMSAQKE